MSTPDKDEYHYANGLGIKYKYNTPDTEITLREALAKIEGLELALSESNKALISRDTYWKERVKEAYDKGYNDGQYDD